EHLDREPIVLRKRSTKKQIDYVETAETRAMRAEVNAQNAFLRTITIDLPGERPANCRWDPDAKSLRRVFTGDFGQGGRWYGAIWQVLTKEERARLTINGEPTTELDIKCCQPRL